MIYFLLFLSFFKIGIFSFGGGYAAMPLIQNQVIDIHGWLSFAEFTDAIAISQMAPGSIAVNSATFVGMRIAGVGGAVISTIGNILPSCIIVTFFAWLYSKYKDLGVIKGVLAGLRPTVVALILSAGLSILVLALWGQNGFSWDITNLDLIAVALFTLGLFIMRKFKLNPLIIMLGSGIMGGACYLLL